MPCAMRRVCLSTSKNFGAAGSNDSVTCERWWGPPTHPATFVDFDLKPGGDVNYYMTSSEGNRYHGWWQFIAINAPKSLEFKAGFSDDSAVPKPDMPTSTVVVSLSELTSGGTVTDCSPSADRSTSESPAPMRRTRDR